MCDATLLPKLKHLQVKPEDLECTSDHHCWCNNISYRFSHIANFEGCMSPREMLESGGSELKEIDKKYLQSLVYRRFISNA